MKRTAATIFLLSLYSPAIASTTFYIDPSVGDDLNAGTLSQPWKTFERAFDSSKATMFHGGDTLYLRGGVYRFDEGKINPPDSLTGLSLSGVPGHQTLFSGYPGEHPIIYLSAPVRSGWQKYAVRSDANIWFVDWESFAKTNYPWLEQHGDTVNWGSTHSGSLVPQLVALDGNPPQLLQQVNAKKSARDGENIQTLRTNQDDMIAGDFYYEKTVGDPNYGLLFVWLPDGSEPNGKPLEIAVDRGLLFGINTNFMISNLKVRFSNGTGLYLSGSNNTMDGVDASYNATAGLIGTCESCTIKNSIFSFNGLEGSGLQGEGTTYENNLFEGNNYRVYSASWHCGGMKLIPNIANMTVRGNTFKNTVSCSDLWYDGMKEGQIIERNTFISEHWSSGGLFLEVTNGTVEKPIVVRNNIFKGPIGVYVAGSSYVQVLNNLFTGGRGISMHGLNCSVEGRKTLTHNKFLNNIVYVGNIPNVTPIPVFIVQDAPSACTVMDNVSDYNLFYTPPGNNIVFGGDYAYNNGVSWQNWQSFGYDKHSLTSDPQFGNYAAGNFVPNGASPVLGAGFRTPYVTDDISGNSRAGRNDIGPYELLIQNPNSSVTDSYFLPFKNVFNPGKEVLIIPYVLVGGSFSSFSEKLAAYGPTNGGSDVSVTVYDRLGNVVRKLDSSNGSQAVWDGKNIQGSTVASGTYTVILKQGSKIVKKKIVVVK